MLEREMIFPPTVIGRIVPAPGEHDDFSFIALMLSPLVSQHFSIVFILAYVAKWPLYHFLRLVVQSNPS